MKRNRRTRHAVLLAMLADLLLLAASAVQTRPLVVWNATASTPVGFWRVLPAASRKHLRVGDYVLFWPDRRSAQLFARRGYLPRGVPLLKRVAAVAGQTVCERDREVSIDSRAIARALPVDGRGRRLAAWSGCGRLPNGEIFVLIPSVPTSLDRRYFGPTPIRAVIGRVTPLWLPGGRTRGACRASSRPSCCSAQGRPSCRAGRFPHRRRAQRRSRVAQPARLGALYP